MQWVIHPRSGGSSIEHGWARVVARTMGLTVHHRSDRPSVKRDQSSGLRLPAGTKKNLSVREGSGEKQCALVRLLVSIIVGVLVGITIGVLVGVVVGVLACVLVCVTVGVPVDALAGVLIGTIVDVGGSGAWRGSSLDLLSLK